MVRSNVDNKPVSVFAEDGIQENDRLRDAGGCRSVHGRRDSVGDRL